MHIRLTTGCARWLDGPRALVVAGVLAGTGGLLGALFAGATGLSPLAVAGYRLLTAGAVLAPLVLRRPLPRGRAAWLRVAVTGLLTALIQAGYFAAVATTSVGLATLVTVGATPVMVLLVERVRGRPASPPATAAGVLGLGLLVGVPSAAGIAGTGFALLAAAGFALLTLLAAGPGPDVVTTTGVGLTLGGALLLAVAAPLTGIGFTPTPAALALLGAFGVLSTALVYALYFRGLRTAPASVGAVTALLEPLTAAVLAAVVLGERLGAAGVAGAALLGVAVVLATGDQRAVRRA